jgi:hypothetical protein
LLTIGLIAFFVYQPALELPSRADQDSYLIETASFTKLSDIFMFSYSYPRVRALDTGDEILFRPFLYAVLSIEKWLFGYNFFLWQLTGLLLHGGVVVQLLRILGNIRPGLWASLFALLFSVVFISQEMVIWHHIHGYLVFTFFLLKAFQNFQSYISSRAEASYLKRMALWMFLATMTYEYGMLCCLILMGGCYWAHACLHRDENIKPQRNAGLILLVPIGVYMILNFVDLLLHPEVILKISAVDAKPWIGHSLMYVMRMEMLSWLGPLFPSGIVIQPGDRLEMLFLDFSLIFNWIHWLNYADRVNLCLLLLLLLLGTRMVRQPKGFWKNFDNRSLCVASVSLLLAFAYIIMLVLGRMGERGWGYMENSLYHFYIIILFQLIAGFILFDGMLKQAPQGNRPFLIVSLCVLLLTIGLNSQKTFRVNVAMADGFKDKAQFHRALFGFVNAHRHEEGFSFRFLRNDFEKKLDYIMQGDPQLKKSLSGTLSDYLYPAYTNAHDPMYLLSYTHTQGLKVLKKSK